MIDLDMPQDYSALDPANMLGRILEMDRQIAEAWRLAGELALPPAYRGARAVLVLGMGGSAIGGDLARTFAARDARVPILVSREYALPGWVGPDTLIIANSYSGGTEETLGATEQALARGALVLAVTTGGRLAQMAGERGFSLLRFSYPAQPRAALGYSLFLLLGVLVKLGLLPSEGIDLGSAQEAIRQTVAQLRPGVPTAQNRAKQLAQALRGKLPVVYGGGILAEVARRWKGQFNENSKQFSFFEQLPELNHNAVVGYQFPRELVGDIVVLMLSSALNHPRLLVREQVTRELLTRAGVRCEVLEASGQGELAHLVSSIVQGDFVSYYLALLNGIDPSAVEVIDYLKARLAEVGPR
ncbi:MAG: bifunctional phosphoglucose/phosphomannose isomerase [Chloroflexi bacterium]|nr:bifunctional phosphoglucose/phosphomannose isomerase [Chloroflexota bacterium]